MTTWVLWARMGDGKKRGGGDEVEVKEEQKGNVERQASQLRPYSRVSYSWLLATASIAACVCDM